MTRMMKIAAAYCVFVVASVIILLPLCHAIGLDFATYRHVAGSAQGFFGGYLVFKCYAEEQT